PLPGAAAPGPRGRFFMVNGGRPPLPPRQRRSRPTMTLDTGEGGPKLPIPAIQVEADRGRRWFLRTTESRSTFARPSTTAPPPSPPRPPPPPPHSRPPLPRPPAPPPPPSPPPPPLPPNRRSSVHDSRSTVTGPSASPVQPPLVVSPPSSNLRSSFRERRP